MAAGEDDEENEDMRQVCGGNFNQSCWRRLVGVVAAGGVCSVCLLFAMGGSRLLRDGGFHLGVTLVGVLVLVEAQFMF